jgi:hypothetical protein
MTSGVPLERRLELLLNTLRGERHMRTSLLLETLEVLVTLNRTAAAAAARELLANVAGIDGVTYDAWVVRVAALALAEGDSAAHAAE